MGLTPKNNLQENLMNCSKDNTSLIELQSQNEN